MKAEGTKTMVILFKREKVVYANNLGTYGFTETGLFVHISALIIIRPGSIRHKGKKIHLGETYYNIIFPQSIHSISKMITIGEVSDSKKLDGGKCITRGFVLEGCNPEITFKEDGLYYIEDILIPLE